MALTGRPLDADLAKIVRAEHLSALTPIDDVRASASSRADATLTLVRRTLQEIAS